MDFVKREDQNLPEDDQYKAYIESLQKSHQMESEYQHTAMSMEQLHQLQSTLNATTIVHNFQLPLSPRQMSTLMFKTNFNPRNFNEIPAHLPRNISDIDLQLSHDLQHCRPEDLVLSQNLGRNLDLVRNLSLEMEVQNMAQSLGINVTEQDLARNLSSDLNLPQNLSHDIDLTQHLNRQNLEQEMLNERRPMIINMADSLVDQNLNHRIEHNLSQNLNLGQRLEQNVGQRLEQNLGQRLVNTMNLHDPQRPLEQNEHLLPMPFHIKSEQEDDGYFYENINQSMNVNGINGHMPVVTEPQPTPNLHPDNLYVYSQNNPNIMPPLNPVDLYSRPQNYVQNYDRENPRNLVVQRQFENNSPYQEEFKKFKQDGVEENGGKKEQRKENLKPTENKIFYSDFNGQTFTNSIEKSDDSNENKLSISEEISVIKGEYLCYKCNEVFPSKRGLKQHAKSCSENGENDTDKLGKFCCSQCAYRCQSPAILKIHERVHSGEKPFSCTFCSYKSGQKNNVAKHMLVHMNQKPFRCQYCDYRCAQKNNLVVHERTHTGFKPFACPYCDYRTVQKPNLVKHMYLHTDQKPFSCDQCSYRCVQKTNLTKHKQRHLNEKDGDKTDVKSQSKPYRPRQKSVKCPHCPYKCVQKSSLEKHMQFKHTDQIAPSMSENVELTVPNDDNVETIQNLSVRKDEIYEKEIAVQS
ncbi:hypothetical protein O0L34_g12074 [Tuta absoluta]|nr:hypothetical protein O0L34_g12074 [Tuta absoluta]